MATMPIDLNVKPAEVFEKATAWSRERLEEATKNYAELSAMSKETVDDVVASGKAAATGFRTIGEAMAAMMQAATTESVETMKKLMTTKSLSDMVALQTAYTKSTLDLVLAHSAKINEAAAQTVIETVEPINARLAAVAAKVEKMRPAA
jgi:phasin family protein